MRILQITSHLNVGGITRYVLSLSRLLAQHGHRVIVASAGGHEEAQLSTIGCTHWHLPLNTSAEFSLLVLLGIRRLSNLLQKEPVDVIHAHTRVAQVVAERISNELAIPYVTTWHGIYKRRIGRQWWPCTGMRTIAISGPVRKHLKEDFGVPEERIRSIHNGIEVDHYATPPDSLHIERFRARWQIQANQPVIGVIGRLAAGRVKGFDSVLVAAYLLEEILPDIQILVVGDGPRRPFLEDVAKRLGLQDHVHFVGEAQDIRIPLALMDIFVFPSRWPEAFGLTLVEAMAAGKPVVATQVGAVPEIIQHGVNGWLVPSSDPSQMADTIVWLLKDRQAASQLGRQAYLRVNEAFNLNRMAAEVEAVYREVAGESRSQLDSVGSAGLS